MIAGVCLDRAWHADVRCGHVCGHVWVVDCSQFRRIAACQVQGVLIPLACAVVLLNPPRYACWHMSLCSSPRACVMRLNVALARQPETVMFVCPSVRPCATGAS